MIQFNNENFTLYKQFEYLECKNADEINVNNINEASNTTLIIIIISIVSAFLTTFVILIFYFSFRKKESQVSNDIDLHYF